MLTEFSGAHTYEKIRNQVYDLVAEGYRPVIAHIERYPCLREELQRVEELIELGAYIQINAGAVLGEGGGKIKRFCRQVMEEDLVHFIASDAHGSRYRKPNRGLRELCVEKNGTTLRREDLLREPCIYIGRRRQEAKIRERVKARKRENVKE